MNLIYEVFPEDIVRVHLSRSNSRAVILSPKGYKTASIIEKGVAKFVYPFPVEVSFTGSSSNEQFYAQEKKYRAEVIEAFEKEYGVLPEHTSYFLFWGNGKVLGVNIVATGPGFPNQILQRNGSEDDTPWFM